MLDGREPRAPIAITFEREDAIALVGLLSQASALVKVWFKTHENFAELSDRLGPHILEQIIAQTDVTLWELQDATQNLKVSGSRLSMEDDGD